MSAPRHTRNRVQAPKPANDLDIPYVGDSTLDEGASANSVGANSPAGPYVGREPSKSLARVFCDFSDRIVITVGEVEIFETYLADLISGMIANDTNG